MTLNVVIEGWRYIPQSYAMVNMWHCYELARRAEINLYHADHPYNHPLWKSVPNLIPEHVDRVVGAVPPPPEGLTPDIVYRITPPMRLGAAQAGRLFTFGTCDFLKVNAEMLGLKLNAEMAGQRSPVTDVLRNTTATIVTPSEWSRRGFIASGTRSDRIAVIPHGFDPSIFHPLPAEEIRTFRQLKGIDDRFIFLNVSSMTRQKGVDLLLLAFAQVRREFPQCLLVLKGTDDLFDSRRFARQQFERVMAKDELDDVMASVQYLGASLSSTTLSTLYNASNAYVCPYRAEGFNLPALEAEACGLPLICTEGGPTDEFTTPESCWRIPSRLVPADSADRGAWFEVTVEDLVAKMRAVILDPQARERARAASADVAHLTWSNAAEQMIRLFQSGQGPGQG